MLRRDPELRALMRERERRARYDPTLNYTCSKRMLEVHRDVRPIRAVKGGNRIGKSTMGGYEVVSAAKGYNPLSGIEYPKGSTIWAVSLDNKRLGHVLRQKIRRFLPVGGYREYYADGIFRLGKRYGGSEIFCMSCEAGPEKFQAFGVAFIWFDEMPRPRGLEIFDESYARIEPGVELRILFTFTPPQGYPWIYRRIWNPEDSLCVKDEDGADTLVGRHVLSIYDASVANGGHLSEKEIAKQIAKYPPSQRLTRIYGDWSMTGDNTYFNEEHVVRCKETARKGIPGRIVVNEMGQTRIERDGHASLYRGWEILEARQPYERYLIGFDVSGGRKRDRSVAYVIARGVNGLPRVVARFKRDDIAPDQFARDVAFPLCLYYNRALACPEINGKDGGAFLQELGRLYRRIYTRVQWDKVQGKLTGDLGWRTDEKTRGMIWASIEKGLRIQAETQRCPVFTKSVCDEIGTIVVKRDENDNERVEHADGAFDDEVFALGIPLTIHFQGSTKVSRDAAEVAEVYEHTDPRMEEIGA